MSDSSSTETASFEVVLKNFVAFFRGLKFFSLKRPVCCEAVYRVLRWSAFLLTFCVIFSSGVNAQEAVELPTGGNKILRGSSVLFFEDASSEMLFHLIKNQKFAAHGSVVPNFGYSSSTIWVKIKINNLPGSGHWGVVVDNPNIDLVELYFNNQKSDLPTSVSFRYEKAHVNHYFPIPEGLHVVYLKITGSELLFMPIKIEERIHLLEERHRSDIWLGLYSGFMISVIFFNLFIYFSLKDTTYLSYFVYNIFITLFIWHTTGYFGHTFGALVRLFDKYSVLTPLAGIFGLIFINRFLRPNLSEAIGKASTYIVCAFLLALCCEFAGLKLSANITSSMASLAGVVYIISACCHSIIIKQYKPAKFLLSAWLVLLTSAVIFNLTSLGFIPYSAFLYNSMQFGTAVETILISLALADRVNMIKKDIAEAEKREHDHIIKHNLFISKQNAALQEAVAIRTQELEKANDIKNRFFSILAHDLQNPLHSLAALLNLFQNEISMRFSREQIISIAQKLGAIVRNTMDLTENLLTWAKSQMEVEQLVSEEIEVDEIVKASIKDLAAMANAKRIRISNQIAPLAAVIADRQHLLFIIRNLLSNAIKFTEPGGEVIIKSVASDGYLHIQIIDNGIGMSKETLKNIFRLDIRKNTPGTNGEKGTGLGLPLCKEFAEKNKGSLYVKSEMGLGSVFVISLPDANLKNPSLRRKTPKIVNEFSFSRR